MTKRTTDQQKHFEAYKRASARIRAGMPHAMDEAVCTWYGAITSVPQLPSPRSVWDLPVAHSMWHGGD